MCVDFSFTVPEIINIRNQREEKTCKLIANEIAHKYLPDYIMALQRRQPHTLIIKNNEQPWKNFKEQPEVTDNIPVTAYQVFSLKK